MVALMNSQEIRSLSRRACRLLTITEIPKSTDNLRSSYRNQIDCLKPKELPRTIFSWKTVEVLEIILT